MSLMTSFKNYSRNCYIISWMLCCFFEVQINDRSKNRIKSAAKRKGRIPNKSVLQGILKTLFSLYVFCATFRVNVIEIENRSVPDHTALLLFQDVRQTLISVTRGQQADVIEGKVSMRTFSMTRTSQCRCNLFYADYSKAFLDTAVAFK